MRKLFNIVVLVALALQVILFLSPYSWGYLYGAEEVAMLNWHGHGTYINPNGVIPYIILVSYGVVSCGLVLLKKWARASFLVLTLVMVLSIPFWGFAVVAPLDGIIGYLVAMSDGAILTIAYLTYLEREFN